MPFVGAAVRRIEDPRLLRGQGGYLEDLDQPRQLHLAVVRSEYPHARLAAIDLERALSVDGVVAAIAASELGTDNRTIHATVTHPALRPCAQPVLADGPRRRMAPPR